MSLEIKELKQLNEKTNLELEKRIFFKLLIFYGDHIYNI